MDKKKDENASFAVGMGAIVAMAVYSQKEMQIKNWLYDNLMLLVLAAFAVLALIVFLGMRKLKKREEEMLKRLKAVNSVKPKRSEGDYYKRRR